MSAAGCPDNATLQALLAGRLQPDEEERLRVHLDDCAGCQQRLERGADQTNFLRNVRERLAENDDEAPDMQAVIHRFRAQIAAGPATTRAGLSGWEGEFSTIAESAFSTESK